LESICIMLLIARKSCNHTNCRYRILTLYQLLMFWQETGIWTKNVKSELGEKYAAVMA
jgi:hypothetical protein